MKWNDDDIRYTDMYIKHLVFVDGKKVTNLEVMQSTCTLKSNVKFNIHITSADLVDKWSIIRLTIANVWSNHGEISHQRSELVAFNYKCLNSVQKQQKLQMKGNLATNKFFRFRWPHAHTLIISSEYVCFSWNCTFLRKLTVNF